MPVVRSALDRLRKLRQSSQSLLATAHVTAAHDPKDSSSQAIVREFMRTNVEMMELFKHASQCVKSILPIADVIQSFLEGKEPPSASASEYMDSSILELLEAAEDALVRYPGSERLVSEANAKPMLKDFATHVRHGKRRRNGANVTDSNVGTWQWNEIR